MSQNGTRPPGAAASDISYLLTLRLDAASFDILQAWRDRYFPRERNLVPAHLSLFHRISREQTERLLDQWTGSDCFAPALLFAKPRRLGGGLAVAVESPALLGIHAHLRERLGGELSRQDSEPFRPHVTVQNKVSAAEASRSFATLAAEFQPWSGLGQSVLVWRYLGGPWKFEFELEFRTDPVL